MRDVGFGPRRRRHDVVPKEASGFGIWALGCGVWCLVLGVWGLEFGFWSSGFEGFGSNPGAAETMLSRKRCLPTMSVSPGDAWLMVDALGFGVWGSGPGVQGLGFGV